MFLNGPNFQDLRRMRADNEFELAGLVRAIMRLAKPSQALDHRKARVGTGSNGAYVMLDDFHGIDLALSLGGKDNVEWDRVIAGKGIRVETFDWAAPDPASADGTSSHGLVARDGTADRDSLASLIARHDRRRTRPNLILKLDIECAEYAAIEALPMELMPRFAQITGEFHGFDFMEDTGWRQLIFRALRKLNKFYAPVHVHANNHAGWRIIAGVPVPAVLEITFANRGLYALTESRETFPTSLDLPCDATRPDMYLGPFAY